MKKKVKIGTASMDSSLYSASFEDSRTRFKHKSLMQDYEELNKETDFMRKKLEMMKQKRLILMAEVRFLRRRCKCLTLDKAFVTATATKSAQIRKLKIGSKSNAKKKTQTLKEAGLIPSVPRFDLNKKTKVCKAAIPHSVVESNNKHMVNNGNEAFRTPMPFPDLNQKEKIINGNENTSSSRLHIFDLNQISREEEELQTDCEQMAAEDSKVNMLKTENDELTNDMKLLICRNIKNGLNRAGKRKVSWQDPVALRV